MAFSYGGRTLEKVGVIGSGQIGPDIALHFTKVLAPHGTPVVVVDIAEDALAQGRSKLEKKVQKGVETKAFKPEQAEAMLANITFTSDYEALRGASLVIEAATEDGRIKGKIVDQLEELCATDAILTSNSSHMEPEVIFEGAKHKNRTAVVHYFFPAERNPVVEIIPGQDTDPALTSFLLGFYETIGKVPIQVKSRYGYAIDPLFEGLLLTSVLLVEEGVATPKEIDTVAQKVLGLGVGPFTAHKLTGGNPITNHGLMEMTEKVGPWFRSPALLQDMVAKGEDWEIPGRGEKIEVEPAKEERIAQDLRATFWGLSAEIVDSGLCSIADLEMAVEMALVINPPFGAMNAYGVKEAKALVESFASRHDGFPVVDLLVNQGESGAPFEIPYLTRRDQDRVAVVTIRRPRVLNALNEQVFDQLQKMGEAIDADSNIDAMVLTGFGQKAFVSGADVGFLAEIENAEQGEATSLGSHRALNAIAAMKKPTICAMNGIAFGGGNELAMACSARLCRKGLKMFVAQPEPNLGIIPGAGATQRLPRLIGMDKAAAMLRTGRPISSSEAVECGLVREEVAGDLVAAAIDLARKVVAGEVELTKIPEGPIDAPASLPEMEIGHLSRAVDAIVCKAILDGAKMTLDEGLRYEAKMFGEVCSTKDMRIGVTNFIKNGPRAKAEFTHS